MAAAGWVASSFVRERGRVRIRSSQLYGVTSTPHLGPLPRPRGEAKDHPHRGHQSCSHNTTSYARLLRRLLDRSRIIEQNPFDY